MSDRQRQARRSLNPRDLSLNDANTTVSCGIPGDDHPGQEVVSDQLRVDDNPLQWDLTARCGFATDFAYAS